MTSLNLSRLLLFFFQIHFKINLSKCIINISQKELCFGPAQWQHTQRQEISLNLLNKTKKRKTPLMSQIQAHRPNLALLNLLPSQWSLCEIVLWFCFLSLCLQHSSHDSWAIFKPRKWTLDFPVIFGFDVKRAAENWP